jgi:hypothetical protein
MAEIFVAHPGAHEASKKQLRDAGVKPDEALSFVQESGVGTTYSLPDEVEEGQADDKAPAKKAAQPNSRSVSDGPGSA